MNEDEGFDVERLLRIGVDYGNSSMSVMFALSDWLEENGRQDEPPRN